jgi:transposase InsO family protein
VIHSDRSVRYASQLYTEMLKQHHAAISMSRKGNPNDNAACESFIQTLKQEEVYRHEIAISTTPAPASENFWSVSITANDFTRLSDTCHPPSFG